MPSRIQIGYLADHQDLIPEMEAAFIAAWPGYYGPGGGGDAAADIDAFCNKKAMPICLVAVAAGCYCGSVTLRATTDSHADLGPWLTALLVDPKRRRQGIGTRLIRSAEGLAGGLGYQTLYARSGTATDLFHRLGWIAFDTVVSADQLLTVFRRETADLQAAARGPTHPS